MANKTVVVIDDGVIKPLAPTDTPTKSDGSALGGTGDVIAPATNTDGYLPQWNGANSKTLKDGVMLDTDSTLAGNSDSRIATQKAVKAYADALIAANDAMVFKGVQDCSSNPNYPAANRGDTYRVSVAGKIGGASGVNVEVGDMYICLTDSTSAGDQATVGTNWSIIQANLDGAVTSSTSSVADSEIVVFDSTSGKVIKGSSGKTIAVVERKRITFTTEFYLDGQNQLSGSLVMDVTSPYAGYLVASSVKMKSARTAGTLDIEPHINGSGLTPTDLDLQIAASPTTKDNATVAYATSGFSVSAGDTIGFLCTTSTFTPLANVATVTLTLEVAA